MGLDAVVFRNKGNLQLGADEQFAEILPDTGEVYFDDAQIERRHFHELMAAHARFDNIALISGLREEIRRIIGQHSLLYTKVVYSGSHSGDFIPVAGLASLSKEVSSVRRAKNPSTDLRRFLDDLDQLIRAAIREGNPIVFV